jgi:predicted aconitase with swiveling domain
MEMTSDVLPENVLTAREVLLSGSAEGEVLRLERPLSFWGGVDPNSGEVTDPRHPQFGAKMAGRIVAMERGIGSSSGSSILLELLSNGNGPVGLLLIEPDAILTLAAVVAREMGYADLPIFLITQDDFQRLPTRLRMETNGVLEAY